MPSLIVTLAVVAVAGIAGILVGFWLRGSSANERHEELARDLTATKSELVQAQAEAAARAGFAALAEERGRRLDDLRGELQNKADAERMLAARVKELEAELRNERQNLAEKLALLETAKKALSDQFEALAAEILDKKSKTFSEGSQKELGTCSIRSRRRSRNSARKWRRRRATRRPASRSWRRDWNTGRTEPAAYGGSATI